MTFYYWPNHVHDWEALLALGRGIVRNARHPDDVYDIKLKGELRAALGPDVRIPGDNNPLWWYLDTLWDTAYKQYLRRGGAIIPEDLHRMAPRYRTVIENAERLWRDYAAQQARRN
eukprot:GHVU01013396.1.p2 GENE.GHVU01013396.1~~GHVU01013396.1.p2  ORF type:complete len:116 (+),score=11.09 GHVU01013396.1:47-394(+)